MRAPFGTEEANGPPRSLVQPVLSAGGSKQEQSALLCDLSVSAKALPDQPKTIPGGIELPTTEQLKAKDLRLALLLGKVPEDSGLLIDTNTTASC